MPATASDATAHAVRERPAVEAVELQPAGRRLRPRWTLRLRLTLLYGGLFLIAGAVLLAITYGLVANGMEARKSVVIKTAPGQKPVLTVRGGPVYFQRATGGSVPADQLPANLPKALQGTALSLQRDAQYQLDRLRTAQLDALLTESGIALGFMAIVSIGLGWVMAGRALRPVRTMSARVRGISEQNLHQRVAPEGPDDELKELGDTFDGLLGRLERAFESQRRFVANASHELRTPITVERTLVEVALADPDASVESLRGTCERVLVAGEQQERLIEALLTLARSQRGLERREPVDLAAVVRATLSDAVPSGGIDVRAELSSAATVGDPALIERLVVNLLDNALHHNADAGWVRVTTGVARGRPTLVVANTGPVIGAEDAALMTEPFRRLNGERTGHKRGLGLGLSIVDAIAVAHGAELHPVPRAAGGLSVEVAFPAV